MPSIDTREIVTQVLVNDGQTVVLGGILETERRDAETKVPWLGDVPVLGHLFKTDLEDRQQGRAADLRDPAHPARGRQPVLIGNASLATNPRPPSGGRFRL